uniref:Uncharacterized protein n=1 Tax=Brassica oleracea TaxID=3712 RepID=A0A3P6DKY1_BRAOL|nr:unnamed protein product [Brassica oleracea]
MKSEHTIETAKDSNGGRVIEAFLTSNAATKQKRRLIIKIGEHFGELSFHTPGSFTVEKGFDAFNLTLSHNNELLDVKANLSKSKQRPFCLGN